MLTAVSDNMREQEQQAKLIEEIAGFLGAWQVQLSEPAGPDPKHARAQRARAELLRARAEGLCIGGLVHHLSRCSDCLGRVPLDLLALRESLRAISEITWQLREELKAAAVPSTPPALDGRLAQSLMAPPLLSSASLSASPVASLAMEACAPAGVRMPVADSSRMLEMKPEPTSPAAPSVSAAAAISELKPPRGSPGLLATLFGLRAFAPSPAQANRRKGERSVPPPAGRARASSLFGFHAGVAPTAPLAAPALVTRRGALPSLAAALPQPAADGAADADLDARLRQIRAGGQRRPYSPSADSRSTGPRSDRHSFAVARWSYVSWSVVLGVMVLGGVLLGKALLSLDRRLQPQAGEPEATTRALEAAPAAGVSASDATVAPARQFQELVAQVHGLGGEESPELAALLEAEANATYQALSQPCGAGSPCAGQREAQDLLLPRAVPRREPRPAGSPPRWLAGLEIPTIGAHNSPEVQRWVEYYTSHSVGRELFQTMLFRCGAYQDLIEKTLVHYGLPLDLLAVVLTESACVPTAESAVGARGLWQFMAPTARAYHLHVEEGVVDERSSPVKSTEAAVKFLADLHRKMGSWEMAFASYNAGSGPFRMLAKLRQAGASATFWDLAEAQLIPEETARYVPRIQAYAVILANLRHFDFSTAQQRMAEETADLEVPARARLGQVARATGTSVEYLRSLNPDLFGTVIPSLPDSRFVLQVPKATAHRARETLGQFLLEQLDLCVPSAFDWGRERFTVEMQSRCAARRSK